MRARSALFTLFGDVVRPAGGDAWLATLTACMGALGFTPEATRTALHRMTSEGWVAPQRVGRYAVYSLTRRGVDRLEEAAARIYRLRAMEWDGQWRLLVCGPDAKPGDRSAFEQALRWMGFGALTGDVWVSPHPHGDRLRRVLEEHGSAPGAHRFLATTPSDPAEDARIVATAWDLGELRSAHEAFIERWRRVKPPADPRKAFTTRIRLVHDWRSFLFLDPGLPAALLPDDWLGESAARTFRNLYDAVDAHAWHFYEAVRSAAPALPGDGAIAPAASPFALGLDALDVTPSASIKTTARSA